MIVAELERALLARYPKTDTEPWDHVGLSVGDPAARSGTESKTFQDLHCYT